jgi:hypothetical protein
MTEPEKTHVEVWNEWDTLKHVIVGVADGACIPPPEPAFMARVPADSDMRGRHGPRTQESIDRANEQLDGLARILEKRGIKTLQMLARIGRKVFASYRGGPVPILPLKRTTSLFGR